MAPRVKRKKIQMKSQQLLEEMPDIEKLGPFPKQLIYQINSLGCDLIVSVDIDPTDSYIAIADE